MKAKDLAEQLLKHPDFDVHFNLFERDDSDYGASLRTFDAKIIDIGHSDKVIKLGGVEI